MEGGCCLTLVIISSMKKLWILSLKTDKVIPLSKESALQIPGNIPRQHRIASPFEQAFIENITEALGIHLVSLHSRIKEKY